MMSRPELNEPQLFEDALDLLDAFSERGVEYLVVGAHALAVHGIPRATADFDVFVNATPENATRVVGALGAFGAPLSSHGIDETDFSTPGTVYQLGLPPRRIDVLTRISGVSFSRAWAAHLEVMFGGRTVPVLGREALIENKRASGRAKDLLDVEALEAWTRGDDGHR